MGSKNSAAENSSSKLEIFKEMIAVDLRSVALYRIGLALVVIADILQRLRDLTAHYTDFGVFPRTAAIENANNFMHVSFHLINGSWQIQLALFGMGLLVAFLMLIGYRSRLMTFLTWAFVISLQGRINFILHGGDVLIRILLFWAMFLPTGAYYSVDRALAKEKPQGKRLCSFASFAILIQICAMYWIAVAQRSDPSWHQDGTAVMYALTYSAISTYWSELLLQAPKDLLKIMTWFTMYLEALGPLIAFIPVFTGVGRLVAYVLFTGMHVTFGFLLCIGLFSYFACVAWFVFLPALFWQLCRRYLKFEARQQLEIQYAIGDTIAERATKIAAVFFFVDSETSEGVTFKEKHQRWAVQTADGTVVFGFDALILLMLHSKVYWLVGFLLKQPVLSVIGRTIYEFFSSASTLLDSLLIELPAVCKIGTQTRLVTNILAVHFLCLGIAWALMLTNLWDIKIPPAVKWSALLTRVDQKWSMFREPIKVDGWHVFPGELANGQKVDVFKGYPDGSVGGTLNWEQPERISATYKNWRWQKMLQLFNLKAYEKYRGNYGKFLCRNWHRYHSGGEALLNYEMVFVERKVNPDATKGPPRRRVLYRHKCYIEERQNELRRKWNPKFKHS